jgi:putative mRNA 3-end processing factor
VAAECDDLIVHRPQGLYCPAGDFYIDPWRKVSRAVITHAHADHARPGHAAYLCAEPGAGVLQVRLGRVAVQALRYGEHLSIGEVVVSLHPAGHVLGSAQVRVEHRGRVWVVSGDHGCSAHDESNRTCAPFEAVRCDCFVTESTFGLPVYRWPRQAEVMAQINAWWQANAAAGCTSVLQAYSFGKAQRLLAGLERSTGPIVVHAAVESVNRAYRAAGVTLPPCLELQTAGISRSDWSRAMLVIPPGAGGDLEARLGEWREASASGWMQLRAQRRRPGLDRGFVLSDHADWPGLLRAIGATGASRVIVTHGYEAAMVRWLQQQGLQASSFETAYGDATPGHAGI